MTICCVGITFAFHQPSSLSLMLSPAPMFSLVYVFSLIVIFVVPIEVEFLLRDLSLLLLTFSIKLYYFIGWLEQVSHWTTLSRFLLVLMELVYNAFPVLQSHNHIKPKISWNCSRNNALIWSVDYVLWNRSTIWAQQVFNCVQQNSWSLR